MPYELPLSITIPIPSEYARGRGINAVTGYGSNVRMRCTNYEYDIVKEVATEMGIPLASFSRWCVVHCAKALRKHKMTQSTDDNAGELNDKSTIR